MGSDLYLQSTRPSTLTIWAIAPPEIQLILTSRINKYCHVRRILLIIQ